ncbi:ATP-binding protein, partial [Nonomuraea longispora]|uniref:ATP-binding protein n=1 Tax=Nonomuraea longispora TaxID=1848320 RepID=UPI001C6FEDA6
DFFAESGRGLFLVEAQADRWGAVQHKNGKYVWFTLQCHGGQPASETQPADPPRLPRTLRRTPWPPSSSPTTSPAPDRTT